MGGGQLPKLGQDVLLAADALKPLLKAPVGILLLCQLEERRSVSAMGHLPPVPDHSGVGHRQIRGLGHLPKQHVFRNREDLPLIVDLRTSVAVL